jgi:hypothetical protein
MHLLFGRLHAVGSRDLPEWLIYGARGGERHHYFRTWDIIGSLGSKIWKAESPWDYPSTPHGKSGQRRFKYERLPRGRIATPHFCSSPLLLISEQKSLLQPLHNSTLHIRCKLQ